VDSDEDVSWAHGWYLSLTPPGRQQIEQLSGPLDVRVHVRRDFTSVSRDRAKSFRLAESRD
jgi:hypothetical protein